MTSPNDTASKKQLVSLQAFRIVLVVLGIGGIIGGIGGRLGFIGSHGSFFGWSLGGDVVSIAISVGMLVASLGIMKRKRWTWWLAFIAIVALGVKALDHGLAIDANYPNPAIFILFGTFFLAVIALDQRGYFYPPKSKSPPLSGE